MEVNVTAPGEGGGGNQGWEQSGVSRAQCLLPQGRWPNTAEMSWAMGVGVGEMPRAATCSLSPEQEPRLGTEKGAVSG